MLNSYNRTCDYFRLAARLFQSVRISLEKAPVEFHQDFAFDFGIRKWLQFNLFMTKIMFENDYSPPLFDKPPFFNTWLEEPEAKVLVQYLTGFKKLSFFEHKLFAQN